MKVEHVYRNGDYIVLIAEDGTKLRVCEDRIKDPRPEFPESVDIKICNRCDMGCPQCHERSVPNGELADLKNPILLTIPPGTELAIGGGNPLEHPDLTEFLYRMKTQKVLCNITVHLKHFINHYSLIERLYHERLIHGVGVSVDRPVNESEMELLKSIPTLVVHVIAGLVTDTTLASLALNDLNLLILGYKDYGRGVDYHARSPFIDQSIFIMKNGIESITKLFRHVSFDQLAVKQLGLQELVGNDTWDESYMGRDGEFTMYLDLVRNEYAVSSISPRHPLKDPHIRNTFASVREEAGFCRYFPPCKGKMKGH